MAINARIIPAKLIFESFSLKTREPISIENRTMQILLRPNIIELSIWLLFKALIKKYNEPKFEIPRTVPPRSSAIVILLDIDFGFSIMNSRPKMRAVKNTIAENSKLILFEI